MTLSRRALLTALPAAALLHGCRRAPAAPTPDPALALDRIPALPAGRLLEPGVRFAEVLAPRAAGGQSRFWVYLPDPLPKKPLRCVVVAPAGTRLFHGIGLGEGDRDEHLPYVRAGFAVVACEIDGPLGDDFSDQEAYAAVRAFRQAEAGIDNVRAAIDLALKRVPRIDPKRVVVAGHSSAATLALQCAVHEPRVRACIAYAPCTDVVARLADVLPTLERFEAGGTHFLRRLSPRQEAGLLRCPLFLFHARDDDNVPIEESAVYTRYVGANPNVRFVVAQSGGHYQSMIAEGIPRAIAWLRAAP